MSITYDKIEIGFSSLQVNIKIDKFSFKVAQLIIIFHYDNLQSIDR